MVHYLCEGIHCPEEKKKNLDREGAHGSGMKASNLQEVGGGLLAYGAIFRQLLRARAKNPPRNCAGGHEH